MWTREFVEQRSAALPAEQLAEIGRELSTSAYLCQNVLNARFATTRGFSVIYREPQQVIETFPCLAPFLALLGRQRGVNLYYLNVLAIRAAGKVDRHVDHSIRGYDASLPLPWRVSVLYLQIPPMDGGELRLYRPDGRENRRIQPETGMLVHFSGASRHAVGEIRQAEADRLSLVCEQYRLSRRQLDSVPDFTVKSMAPFTAFLAEQG